jgi:O-methyltransferase involved in polyketide biosynthesis
MGIVLYEKIKSVYQKKMKKEKGGNKKISFTAQAICLMRSVLREDKYSPYFLTSRVKRQYFWVRKLTPEKKLREIFERRIQLSREIDTFINRYKPSQILELASGYSPRGILLTQKNKKLTYLETDFESVINYKKEVFKLIEKEEKISLSKNQVLVPFDVVSGNFNSLSKYFNKNKKTLVLAETLANYLNEEEHEKMLKNIQKFLGQFNNSAYLSHESKFAMTSSFLGKIFMLYRNIVAKTENIVHFVDSDHVKFYFLKNGFKKVQILDSKKTHNIIYLATLK